MARVKPSKAQIMLGLVVSLGLLVLALLFLRWLWQSFGADLKHLNVTLVVAVLTVGGSVWVARSTKLKDRELQIQAQQAQRKEEVCSKFMSDIWAVTQDPDKAKDLNFVRDMLRSAMVNGSLWWSDNTLKAFVEFRRSAVADSQNVLKAAARVILCMRTDLGHKNKGLSEKDMLDVFLKDTEELFTKS